MCKDFLTSFSTEVATICRTSALIFTNNDFNTGVSHSIFQNYKPNCFPEEPRMASVVLQSSLKLIQAHLSSFRLPKACLAHLSIFRLIYTYLHLFEHI